mmetsp:Transcript_9078/g.20296  ORF Transcript_9078/g.20296 Transcript_9078/m.20296 type:complete len:202 (+) Transcript_9078:3058-3663(+)
MTSFLNLTSLLLLCILTASNGFVTPKQPRVASSSSLSATSPSSRRSFISTTMTSFTVAISLLTQQPQAALAKKEVIVLTPTLVSETFSAIRSELTSSDGVVATLAKLIEDGSYEDILQYTKESDAYFRKAKMGKARKLLTDESLKGDAVLMSNAVTFDLIGINRASRPGKENKDEQLRYLEELKKDIGVFLELESTIVIPE